MKAILLAGGLGTRLYPLTKVISKQLIPVYDKPTIYYPLSTIMLAGVRDILIISTPHDLPFIQNLLGDGRQLGIYLSYAAQKEPRGIAEAFLIGEHFIDKQSVLLILGDNIFYGHCLPQLLREAVEDKDEFSHIFAYRVQDPQRYGVVSFNDRQEPVAIREKPKGPDSPWAVTGIYVYDPTVVQVCHGLQPSQRGELEITDVNLHYLRKGRLKVHLMGRGYAWFDTGTYESLISCSQFIQTLELRQNVKIGCIEEIAYEMGFIDKEGLISLASQYRKSPYGQYLQNIVHNTDAHRLAVR